MSEWREVPLGDVASISWGDTTKTKASYTSEGCQAYSASGPDGRLPHADHSGEGVVVSAIGAKCGKTWFAQGDWSCIKNTMWVKGGPDTDTRFLYYATADPTQWPRRGAAQPFISLGDAKRMKVLLPSLPTQRAVAAVLRSLDELAENNRRRIKVLEEMARTIYREWFVHFRYPGHEVGDLVESSLGPIPQGWEAKPLMDVASLVRGRSYRKHELVDQGGLPFINLKCMMRGGGFRRDGLKRYSGVFGQAQLAGHGDIVLAVTDLTQQREILARATLVPRLQEQSAVISLDVARIVPIDAAERLWIFAALRWSDFGDRVREYANGSTVLHLSPSHVSNGLVLWPTNEFRDQYSNLLEPMMAEIDELNDASEHLAAMRDLLLPKLVTGQIDVSALDAAESFERAVA